MTEQFDYTSYSYNLDEENFQTLYKQYKDALKIIKNLKKENEQLKSELEFWKKQAKQCPMRSYENE